MANEAEQAIYQRLASAPLFHPASVELLPEDWGIETGDVVSVKSGEETYSVPVYSHTLVWNGKSKATIESTGHQEREPLPELRRKEYQQGRSSYGNSLAIKQANEDIDNHWVHVTQVTDKGMSDSFGIIGVKIGADGMPMKDASGNYIWDDTGTGGEIWGHLNRSAWTTVIQNHIQDANGRILSIGQVLTSADGQALITAINDQRTGTATINANRIKLKATDTITLDALLGIEANTQQLRVIGDLYVDDTVWATDISALSSIHSDITIDAPTIEGGYGRFQNLYCKSTFDQYGELTGGEDVSAAFKDMQFIVDPQNSGHFILQGKTLANPNAWVYVTNFNIAATQYYIDGVAARTAHSISRITLGSSDIGTSSQPVTVYSTDDWEEDLSVSVDASAVYSAGVSAGGNAGYSSGYNDAIATVRLMWFDGNDWYDLDTTMEYPHELPHNSTMMVAAVYTNAQGEEVYSKQRAIHAQ